MESEYEAFGTWSLTPEDESVSEEADEVDRKCDFLRNQAETLTAECEALRMSLNTIHREHAAKIVCYAHDLLASRDEVTSLRVERDALQAEVAGLRKERDELFASAKAGIDHLKRKGNTYDSVHETCQMAWRIVYPSDARPPFVPPEKPELRLFRRKDVDRVEWLWRGKDRLCSACGIERTPENWTEIDPQSGEPLK